MYIPKFFAVLFKDPRTPFPSNRVTYRFIVTHFVWTFNTQKITVLQLASLSDAKVSATPRQGIRRTYFSQSRGRIKSAQTVGIAGSAGRPSRAGVLCPFIPTLDGPITPKDL
jgi:hypothetical protein